MDVEHYVGQETIYMHLNSPTGTYSVLTGYNVCEVYVYLYPAILRLIYISSAREPEALHANWYYFCRSPMLSYYDYTEPVLHFFSG
jgi:hypothetical protein